MIRQGDVLLIPADAIPETTTTIEPEEGRHILARGEATGHHHSIMASPSTALFAAPNDEMYLLIQDGTALLEHQEHATLPVTGLYRVVRQREWDETRRDWRSVLD